MSSYYRVSVTIKKEALYDNLLSDFYAILYNEGFNFLHADKGFEGMSLGEILDSNSKKLLSDFELSPSDSRALDYRQMYLSCPVLKSSRLYITNFKEDDFFCINLLFSEENVVKYHENGFKFRFLPSRFIKKLVLKIWELPFVFLIDTFLENSDEIRKGLPVSAKPFSIIHTSLFNFDIKNLKAKSVKRNGILITFK